MKLNGAGACAIEVDGVGASSVAGAAQGVLLDPGSHQVVVRRGAEVVDARDLEAPSSGGVVEWEAPSECAEDRSSNSQLPQLAYAPVVSNPAPNPAPSKIEVRSESTGNVTNINLGGGSGETAFRPAWSALAIGGGLAVAGGGFWLFYANEREGEEQLLERARANCASGIGGSCVSVDMIERNVGRYSTTQDVLLGVSVGFLVGGAVFTYLLGDDVPVHVGPSLSAEYASVAASGRF